VLRVLGLAIHNLIARVEASIEHSKILRVEKTNSVEVTCLCRAADAPRE
jgi:hypothetical protein